MSVQAQRFGGEHTDVKLDIISQYLKFFTTALSGKFELVYVDPFCGSGFYKTNSDRQEDRQVHVGSALRALGTIAPIRVNQPLDNHPHRSILDRVFGDDSWSLMYQDGFKLEYDRLTQIERAWQPMLGQLGDIDPQHSIRGPEAMITYLYRRRLRSVLPTLSDVRAALYVNSQPHFELIFGIANPSVRAGQLATDVANYILENHPSVQIKD